MKVFPESKSFGGDESNINKNWHKHRVHYLECEEIFFNEPIITKVEKRGVPSGRDRASFGRKAT